MKASEFVDFLEAKQLLEPVILEQLRQLLSRTDQVVTTDDLMKLLVDQGHLTRFQGARLLANAPASGGSDASEDELEFKYEESLDGQAVVEPQLDEAQPGDDQIVDLTSHSDESEPEEEIVDLEQAVTQAPAGVVADPMLDPLSSPASQAATTSAYVPDGTVSQQELDQHVDDRVASTLSELQVKSNPWDTKLIVLGSGSFGLLCVAAIFLYLSISSYPPAEMLAKAKKDYIQGSYTQAIAKYEQFLKKYPRHAEASLAKVMIGMSKINQVAKTPKKALERCISTLGDLAKQESFHEARAELAILLPGITESFMDGALKSTDLAIKKEYLDLSKKSLELVNITAYIPARARRENLVLVSQLERIETKRISLERHIERDTELRTTISQMRNAAEDKNTRQAFILRDQLLADFPELENYQDLRQAVLDISASEQELVKPGKTSYSTFTTDHDLSNDETVMVTRQGDAIPGANPDVAFVLAGGSVYGIEVESGEVLWRRFVGFETTLHPQKINPDADADVLLADGKRNELLRLDARSGKLVWRLEVKSSFSQPLIVNQQVVINTRPISGNDTSSLLRINIDTGTVDSQVQFPMTLSTPPAYDPESELFYQLGDHSNLYVISEETGECQDVQYIGHRDKSVVVGAVAAVGYVLVCENVEAGRCIIRIYVADKENKTLALAQGPLALKGRVIVPPLQYDRRVLITTDLGEIRVLEVDPNLTPPVQEMAGIAASFTTPVVQYPLVDRGLLWIAGRQFARYRVQAVLGELTLDWVDNDGDVYVAPMQRSEDVVIHVRRQRGSTAVTVAGHPVDARKPSWQTSIGGTSSVSVDRKNNLVTAISSQAGLFRFQQSLGEDRYLEQPAPDGLETAAAYSKAVELGDGRIALLGSPDVRTLLYSEPGIEGTAQLVGLQGIRGEMVTATGFAGQLLATFNDGSVRLFELPAGSQQVSPFQPSLRPSQRIQWSIPAVHPDPDRGFVVLRDQQQLFRVQILEQPRPHLAQMKQKQLPSPVYPQLAALGDAVVAVRRSAGHDSLVAYSWDELEELEPPQLLIEGQEIKTTQGGETTEEGETIEVQVQSNWDLTGRVVWGPYTVGQRLVLLNDRGTLVCFNENLELAWKSTGQIQQLAGIPVLHEGDFIFVSLAGSIWRVNGKNGKMVGTDSIQKPVFGRPVVFADRLWLSGADGTIHVVPIPSREGGQSS
jgi:outer membrane protein assembly factor BamB/TolA-binding protein